jgi:hypothetical protein
VQDLRQLTTAELDQVIGHASALAEMRRAMPVELYIKLDTYLADLRAEQEDRQTRRN